MNFFLLPHAHPLLYKKIDIYNAVEEENQEAVHSLSHYLYEIKDKLCVFDSWDIYKEYTNPYEFIHTKIPNRNTSISSYVPLSRSYFKMVELIKQFNVFDKYKSQAIHSFHLAEGPGGFIEAAVNMRKIQSPLASLQDQYYGITLINEKNQTIPSWKKSHTFLKNNPRVFLEYGADKTGNLLHIENFTGLVDKYGSKMSFITADGGFNFSDDFNRQEISIIPLLVAQICTALCLQKMEGTFILKVFDCFLKPTQDLLYLLSSFYEKVYVTKPLTSRIANSEKYIVCMNFHYEHYVDYYPYLFHLMKMTMAQPAETHSLRFLRMSIPRFFLSKLDEYNMILGHQQINNIFSTIALMNNKINKTNKLDYLVKTNIAKCIFWCNKYGIPYNLVE